MKTMKQKYTLNIADLQISVISDAPAEEVQKIGGILDRKMREIYLKSRCPKTEAALLCALECVAERIGLTERTAELEDKCAKYGVVLDGLAPGIKVDKEMIAEKLSLRRPFGAISTRRVEPDHFRIVMLPEVEELRMAMRRMGEFLDGYCQKRR